MRAEADFGRPQVCHRDACLSAGAVSLDTIAAGQPGVRSARERAWSLRAHELIIVDVFPRHTASGYYGDMTRTFLRGRASDAQRRLVAAVRAAQRLALEAIHAGVNGRDVHNGVAGYFNDHDYPTRHTPRRSTAFFTAPAMDSVLPCTSCRAISGTVDYELKAGAVVTVEPGLYYPGLGACRIEDVVQVTAGGRSCFLTTITTGSSADVRHLARPNPQTAQKLPACACWWSAM